MASITSTCSADRKSTRRLSGGSLDRVERRDQAEQRSCRENSTRGLISLVSHPANAGGTRRRTSRILHSSSIRNKKYLGVCRVILIEVSHECSTIGALAIGHVNSGSSSAADLSEKFLSGASHDKCGNRCRPSAEEPGEPVHQTRQERARHGAGPDPQGTATTRAHTESDREGPAKYRRRCESRCDQARDQGREGAFGYGCRYGRRVAQDGSSEQRRTP